jgi:hypothetical protein
MSRLARWLLFQLGRDVTRDQALEIARTACEARGAPWLEPIKVYRHYGDWAVWTFGQSSRRKRSADRRWRHRTREAT